jgi:hypothetical protein
MRTSYFASVGPIHGPFLYRNASGKVGVLETPESTAPIGDAVPTSWLAGDIALWRLRIRDVVLPGRWVIVDRHFRLAL